MSQRRERMIAHQEGNGRLLSDGKTPLPVRYFLDTWCETIATGTAISAEMKRSDGFVWWNSAILPDPSGVLETEDGQQLRVNLFELKSNRAYFCRVRRETAYLQLTVASIARP